MNSHATTPEGLAAAIAVDEIVTRRRLRLDRDPGRVIVRLFVPGAYVPDTASRAGAVVRRVLALPEKEAEAAYARTLEGFSSRHRHLEGTFATNFETVAHRIGHQEIGERRRLLIGAHFTHEYAIEGAALTNPSMVEHPDQSGLEPGELRFLMSARAIGEGHLSCVEFRTGVVGPQGQLRVDEPAPYAGVGSLRTAHYERSMLEAALGGPRDDDEVLAYLMHHLPECFTDAELQDRLGKLPPQLLVLEQVYETISRIHWFIACQYRLGFDADTSVSERVLWPISPTERRGMEDARFVKFTDADGDVSYKATYSAYNGSTSATQLIRTRDFRTFEMTQLFGEAVGSKGLALFPRTIDGRHVALSRWDGETNSLAVSEDGQIWTDPTTLRIPERDWELVQTGNCGSPIETEAGWLVLTHGVGPMRAYAIGAALLDLDDPTKVIGALDDPLLTASLEERDGYVPNVVYSCGALRHGDVLVIPYGFGDMGIEFATVPIPALLDRLTKRP